MRHFMLVISIIIGLAAAFVYNAIAEEYPKTMIVTDIDYLNDIVTLTDFNGEQWQFEGVEDWFIGDFASCIMEDNNTDVFYDDSIKTIRYDGWIDRWDELAG